MTERVTRPASAAKCNWATGGSAYPKGDPGSGKRDVGYKPKDYPTAGNGDVIPAEDHNFLWNLGMDMLSWLRDFAPSEWSDVAEGIANAPNVSQLFRVYPPITGQYATGELDWNATGTATGGGAIVATIETDGEQVYYVQGSPTYIVAANPINGSEIWEQSIAGVQSIATDGGFVYYIAGAGAAGLNRISRSTGAADTSGGTEYSCNVLEVNGSTAVALNGNVGSGYITFFYTIQGTITQGASQPNPTTNLVDICMDGEKCFTTGTRSTYDVWSYRLSDRVLSWQVALPTTGAPTTRGICTDGHYVYVVTDRIALTAGGDANLFILDRAQGTVLQSVDIAPTADLGYVNTDGSYLYCVGRVTAKCYIVPLRGPTMGTQAGVIDDVALKPACDGVSAVFRDFTTNTNLQRNWAGGASRLFMRAASDDVYRRPFFNLAIPADGRL